MTLFWNLLQDHRFFKERERSRDLEERITVLETQMSDLQDLIKRMVYETEILAGKDINKDGSIGHPRKRPLKEELKAYRERQIEES